MFKKICIFLLYISSIFASNSKSKLLLLKVYKDQNISGWVVSEKLDGIFTSKKRNG